MSQEDGWTRRQFSRRIVESAVGLLAASGAAEAQPVEPPSASGEKPPTSSQEDPRIVRIEKERSVPLSEAQRKGLPAQLKDLDETTAALRKFRLTDGGSEPGSVFSQ